MVAPSIDPPRDLTIPEAGSTTARGVLSRAIGRLLSELCAIPRGVTAPGPARDELDTFRARMIALLKAQPGALASVVRRPTVGALLRTLRRDLPRGAPLDPEAAARADALITELVPLVYFDLAIQGSLPQAARVTRLPPRLLSLPGRVSLALDGARAVTFGEERVTIERADGTQVIELDTIREGEALTAPPATTRPYHPIAGSIQLALADNNPLSMFEAHPDKEGNAIELGGRPASEWVGTLRASLDLIGEFLPDLRGEIDLFIQQIVPVGWDEQRHLSASYQEAIGTLYMTLHPSLMTMTEAVIHEFSHNKINALFELDDVLENAFSPLYASPVRPDPRPLHGVLLAVHAFLPVARLYEAMLAAGHPLAQNPSFEGRYARIRGINAEGAAVVLENGRATRVGRGVLDELRRWDEHFAGVA